MTVSDRLLNDALYGAACDIGSAVTPAELAQRGIRRVRYIPREKMAALLERTVARALEERRVTDSDVSLLVGDVQTGLLGLLRGAQEVETARRDIAEQRHSLQGDLAAIVRERSPAGDLHREPTLAEPESDAEKAIRERDVRIDRLERRVAKLIKTLEETELVLKRAMVTRNLDTGIASLYRVVQGLSTADAQAEQKHAMMKEIFQANLELNSAFAYDRPIER
jgi:hypothetical protein